MARSDAVWAIDVGQCALKALRCRAHAEKDRIIAEAFDYIEYPKILSQPGADAAELIDEALKQFLSRNTVKGDRVAISVSGQSGLARFIKLPPVEAKKIPDIVRYEARQQIPFDLNDVIWDYQRMGVGSEEEGFALETEIGLFAMKRDAVFRTLEPFQKAGIAVDFVQLAPLALYNFILFDQLTDLPPADEYDPENPPDSVVVLSLGTDATDLVVTNGFRVWQRSVPLGGNHFTKALTKELKLTFAKAEHLKRNAGTAQDPKAVFQAMRPVFRDLLTELQRSIGYFTSIDRAAKISHVVALGNAMKLPGLRRYLTQSLGFEVHRLEEFRGLRGSQVLTAPAFKGNSLCFGVCYGLALQALGKSGLGTNLLPKEILKDRLIRQKKPWAVAAAAAVLLACGISFGAYSRALSFVEKDKAVKGTKWADAERSAAEIERQAGELQTAKTASQAQFDRIVEIGNRLTGNVEGRLRWLELLRTLDECLPPYPDEDPSLKPDDPAEQPDDTRKTAEELAKEISERKELHITSLRCDRISSVEMWLQTMQNMNPVWYQPAEQQPAAPGQPPAGVPPAGAGVPPAGAGVPPVTPGVPGATPGVAGVTPGFPGATPVVPGAAGVDPAGAFGSALPGTDAAAAGSTRPIWVITLTGHHFHNFDRPRPGEYVSAEFVRETLLRKLATATVILPTADRQDVEAVSTEELGISHPVLVNPGSFRPHVESRTGGVAEPGVGGPITMGDAATSGDAIELLRFDFEVQFCWQPRTPSERLEAREEKKLLQQQQAALEP